MLPKKLRLVSLGVLLGALLVTSSMTAEGGINSWTNIGPEGGSILALAIDPMTPATLYAGTSSGGVFKSTNGGGSWSAVNTGLTNLWVDALAVNPQTPATLYAGTGSGVFKSTDAGASWTAVNTGLTPTNFFVTTLAIDPQTPATLYAGGDGGGVFKSTNGGGSWSAGNNTGLTAVSVYALAIDPQMSATLYAGASAGVFKITNGGGSWSAVNTGLPGSTLLAIDPQTPTTLYAGTPSGGLFKSTNGGGSWSYIGFRYYPTYALAIDPTTLYAGGDGGVAKSTDGGGSWSGSYLACGRWVRALAIDPVTPTTIYAGNSCGVFKSINGGVSWSAVNTGLPILYGHFEIAALAIDPLMPTTLYAGTQGGVFKSINGGGSWSAVNTGLPNSASVGPLAIDPQTPDTLYAGTGSPAGSAGVFKSTNGGANWSAFNDGLTNLFVSALAIDPQTPATLYAGTGSGVFVFNGATDLAITKSDSPDPVIAGTDVTYSINVTNSGPIDATSVVVTDNLPPEVRFISCTSSGGGTCGGSGNNRTVSFASLAPGASASITIVANVNAATPNGATISNTASVASKTPDTNPGNNSSTATTSVINQADLAVVKTASAATVETGTNATYTITVTNKGPNSASNVTLEDNLPAGTTFVSSSIPSGWACTTPQAGSAGLISCKAVSLASGATATFTVVVNIGCAVSNASVINNTATIRSATPDPTLANNAATAGVSVSNPPPTVTAAVATASLWPPNSTLINVGLSATTSDGACPAPAVSSVRVWSDEDDETSTSGSEAFSPDAKDFGIGTLQLRAKRAGSLDGRVYLIVVRATDTGGATGFGTATVVVPKSASPSAKSSVAAQAASAKAYADANNGNPPPGYFVIGDGRRSAASNSVFGHQPRRTRSPFASSAAFAISNPSLAETLSRFIPIDPEISVGKFERSISAGFGANAFAPVDAGLDALRRGARSQDLLRRLGLDSN